MNTTYNKIGGCLFVIAGIGFVISLLATAFTNGLSVFLMVAFALVFLVGLVLSE
jgi:uncharacterized membrane protein